MSDKATAVTETTGMSEGQKSPMSRQMEKSLAEVWIPNNEKKWLEPSIPREKIVEELVNMFNTTHVFLSSEAAGRIIDRARELHGSIVEDAPPVPEQIVFSTVEDVGRIAETEVERVRHAEAATPSDVHAAESAGEALQERVVHEAAELPVAEGEGQGNATRAAIFRAARPDLLSEEKRNEALRLLVDTKWAEDLDHAEDIFDRALVQKNTKESGQMEVSEDEEKRWAMVGGPRKETIKNGPQEIATSLRGIKKAEREKEEQKEAFIQSLVDNPESLTRDNGAEVMRDLLSRGLPRETILDIVTEAEQRIAQRASKERGFDIIGAPKSEAVKNGPQEMAALLRGKQKAEKEREEGKERLIQAFVNDPEYLARDNGNELLRNLIDGGMPRGLATDIVSEAANRANTVFTPESAPVMPKPLSRTQKERAVRYISTNHPDWLDPANHDAAVQEMIRESKGHYSKETAYELLMRATSRGRERADIIASLAETPGDLVGARREVTREWLDHLGFEEAEIAAIMVGAEAEIQAREQRRREERIPLRAQRFLTEHAPLLEKSRQEEAISFLIAEDANDEELPAEEKIATDRNMALAIIEKARLLLRDGIDPSFLKKCGDEDVRRIAWYIVENHPDWIDPTHPDRGLYTLREETEWLYSTDDMRRILAEAARFQARGPARELTPDERNDLAVRWIPAHRREWLLPGPDTHERAITQLREQYHNTLSREDAEEILAVARRETERRSIEREGFSPEKLATRRGELVHQTELFRKNLVEANMRAGSRVDNTEAVLQRLIYVTGLDRWQNADVLERERMVAELQETIAESGELPLEVKNLAFGAVMSKVHYNTERGKYGIAVENDAIMRVRMAQGATPPTPAEVMAIPELRKQVNAEIYENLVVSELEAMQAEKLAQFPPGPQNIIMRGAKAILAGIRKVPLSVRWGLVSGVGVAAILVSGGFAVPAAAAAFSFLGWRTVRTGAGMGATIGTIEGMQRGIFNPLNRRNTKRLVGERDQTIEDVAGGGDMLDAAALDALGAYRQKVVTELASREKWQRRTKIAAALLAGGVVAFELPRLANLMSSTDAVATSPTGGVGTRVLDQHQPSNTGAGLSPDTVPPHSGGSNILDQQRSSSTGVGSSSPDTLPPRTGGSNAFDQAEGKGSLSSTPADVSHAPGTPGASIPPDAISPERLAEAQTVGHHEGIWHAVRNQLRIRAEHDPHSIGLKPEDMSDPAKVQAALEHRTGEIISQNHLMDQGVSHEGTRVILTDDPTTGRTGITFEDGGDHPTYTMHSQPRIVHHGSPRAGIQETSGRPVDGVIGPDQPTGPSVLDQTRPRMYGVTEPSAPGTSAVESASGMPPAPSAASVEAISPARVAAGVDFYRQVVHMTPKDFNDVQHVRVDNYIKVVEPATRGSRVVVGGAAFNVTEAHQNMATFLKQAGELAKKSGAMKDFNALEVKSALGGLIEKHVVPPPTPEVITPTP